ncbi:hypothetical protein BHE74_00047840 [Ensete ventricosum]|nr:hypothetical protein BHE74_00047840 [Ensete ventricosum]
MNSNVQERQQLVLGDATVVSAFGSLFGAAKRVAAAWCWRHSVQNEASGCSFERLQGRRSLRLQERWRGWRLGRRLGWGISLEIYSGERKDAKVAATVSALVGRSVLISLVPSVAEADVATVDGLESTTKSTRDRKR